MDAGIEQIVGAVEPVDRARRGHCAEGPEAAHPDRPCAEHVAGKSNSHAAPSGSPSCTLTRRCAASQDRKSTRLNSSHLVISYAVFCLKKKTMQTALPPASLT